jgi:hypothetical protein
MYLCVDLFMRVEILQKRAEILAQKRLGSEKTAPKIIGIVALSPHVDMDALRCERIILWRTIHAFSPFGTDCSSLQARIPRARGGYLTGAIGVAPRRRCRQLDVSLSPSFCLLAA